MKKFRLLSVFIFLISVSKISEAQEERGMMGIGISAGASNYEGDLDDDFTLVFTRPGFGAHAIFLIFSRVHFRVAIYHGEITADDSKANFTDNTFRNLRFYSNIDEVSMHVMYTLQNRKRGFTKRNLIAPYIFLGVGYYRFDPRRKVNGKEYDLQKTGTEGQYLPGNYPEPYKLQQFSIPFGIGFRIKVTQHFDFGAETGFRKTFTDYLDDVSGNYPDKNLLLATEGSEALYLSDSSRDPQFPNGKSSFSTRGNSSNKDWYVYTNINFTYYFTTSLFKSYRLKSQYKNNSCKGLSGS